LWCVGVCTVALLAAAAISARRQKPATRHLTGPLDVCDFGAFFVGGIAKLTQYANSNTLRTPYNAIIGQMYVRFMIPDNARLAFIMVHGGGYSGSGLGRR
jgi:hypothetical protein